MKSNASEIPSRNSSLASASASGEQPGEPTLASVVASCGQRPEVLAALADLYRQADATVAATGAICFGGGACCRFDLAGHRLYVSPVELAMLVQRPPPTWPAQRGRCAYQQGPRCHARDRRPLGCRTYFCNTRHTQVLQDAHEQYHLSLRRLHDKMDVAYRYVELTGGLAACLQASL